ncbi:hypothetical protein CDL15_Pgr013976 [Punica granatum]|uniref:Leucine-rich repeat-containing N-terminal plant-type domain-containing protein n=1 Tax=Punica granatum TaxID=22663 RepID=A0A218W9R4_PUNGR|nr:hypothetical protein CDL15_Pgr013976 [Punica granatum]
MKLSLARIFCVRTMGVMMLLLLGCELTGKALGCKEGERLGQLNVKAAFNFPNGTALPTWRADKEDCCQWERINCSNIRNTMQVTKLQLSGLPQPRSLDAGALFPSGLCELASLETLSISGNELAGSIPRCLFNMTTLHTLDLSYNHFGGAIPPSLFSSLKLLESLSLSGNAFEGSFSHGFVPSFLMEQHDLEVFELFNCRLEGQLPSWLLENNTNLGYFNLMGSSFSGHFSLNSSLTNYNMWLIDVASNSLEGELPSYFSYVFPNLGDLNVSRNSMQGRIPSSLCHSPTASNLRMLDLSTNRFIGELPEKLMRCEILGILILANNNLRGQVLPRVANLSLLTYLSLSDNQFYGEISTGLLNSPSLSFLDMSSNNLSGVIPDWIGDLQELSVLSLADNSIEGTLPLSFCKLQKLEFLNLAGNDIGPSIPSCVNVSALKHLHLERMNLKGSLPQFLQAASSIVTLSLSSNALSGGIPSWIGSLSTLRVLLLAGNSFEGLMPQELCQLHNISIMDLSHNHLSGRIPSYFNKLAFGSSQVPDGTFTISGYGFTWAVVFSFPYVSTPQEGGDAVEVLFTSKHRLESYGGRVLPVMSGLDLSCNNLSGSIPLQLGNLSDIRSLNLSYNHLSGSIPVTISNLDQIECLDLSHNNLSGEIPQRLIELYRLSTFSVAYNNLSGRTPEPKYQFATFFRESYEGNSFLCGWQLGNCRSSGGLPLTPPPAEHQEDIFRTAFRWSFAGSYAMAFIGTVFTLCLSSYFWTLFFDFVYRHIPSSCAFIDRLFPMH